MNTTYNAKESVSRTDATKISNNTTPNPIESVNSKYSTDHSNSTFKNKLNITSIDKINDSKYSEEFVNILYISFATSLSILILSLFVNCLK